MINLPRKGSLTLGSFPQPPGLLDGSGSPGQCINYSEKEEELKAKKKA